MSTIFSLWNRDGEHVNREFVDTILSSIVAIPHDGQECWLQDEIALANQYYWITPEEVDQAQPLVDPQNGWVLSSSCRLDNRLVLIKTLGLEMELAGLISDAELILKAYQKWGKDCAEHLLGDFAFILWDPHNQWILAARDCLGGCELYYTVNDRILILASRLSMILDHPAIKSQLNEYKIARYLAVIADDHDTFYEGIYHLDPAHCLLVSPEKVQLWRYWQIDPSKRIHYKDSQDYGRHYYELMLEATRCCARSAYPLGMSLSGGLDSSSLMLLLSEVLKGSGYSWDQVRTYSYVFNDLKNCDETEFIEAVVSQSSLAFATDTVLINGDHLCPAPLNDDWLINRDHPFQDPYFYLINAILCAAHNHDVRVMLSGFYGDDLYSGEEYWLIDSLLDLRMQSTLRTIQSRKEKIDLRKSLYDFGIKAVIPEKFKKVYRNIRGDVPAWAIYIPTDLFSKAFGLADRYDPAKALFFTRPGRRDRFVSLFSNGYPENLTELQDIASRNGICYAFPFVYRPLVEYILAVPTEEIALPGQPRRILREAMNGRLPDKINKRQEKTALIDLFDRGMLGPKLSIYKALLRNSQVADRGFIRADWLAEELEQPTRTQGGLILWLVIALEVWLRKYWNK